MQLNDNDKYASLIHVCTPVWFRFSCTVHIHCICTLSYKFRVYFEVPQGQCNINTSNYSTCILVG